MPVRELTSKGSEYMAVLEPALRTPWVHGEGVGRIVKDKRNFLIRVEI